MALTKPQRWFMERALVLMDHHGYDGICPGGGQAAMAKRLEAVGLMQFEGRGHAVDDVDRWEAPIYSVTDAGRAALAADPEPRGKG